MFLGEIGMDNEDRILQRAILKNLVAGQKHAERVRSGSIQKVKSNFIWYIT